jgi:IclR family transcriptional regulator, pca regulon regulatory protein
MTEPTAPAEDGEQDGRLADDQYLVQSLVRGVELLRCFNRQQPALSIPEITELTRLNRTTVFRFLHTLRQLGLVSYDAETRRYSLGIGVLQLGFEYLNGLPLVDRATPLLRALRDELGESTHLGVLDGSTVVYLARVPIDRIMSAAVSVGARLPAASTSMGRMLLAHLAEDRLKEVLRGIQLQPRTPRSPATPAELREVLATVRRQGYAITDQEYEPGVFSVAAPVRDRAGEVIAAINVTGPVDRFTPEAVAERHLPAVRRTASDLSVALGAALVLD